MRFFYFLLLFSFFILPIAPKVQQVIVNGTLICDGYTAGNAVVTMFSKTIIGADDKLTLQKTSPNGRFLLVGKAEILREPYLVFRHMCQMKENCKRFQLEIPEKYIDSGKNYEMNYVSLNILWNGEEMKKCDEY